MVLDYRDKGYLLRIKEYCERIENAKARFGSSFEAFRNDPDFKDVVCMNLFQIGELANQVSDEVKCVIEDIPWTQMYGIRNILAHAYIKVDDKIVWETVERDIPKLKECLLRIV